MSSFRQQEFTFQPQSIADVVLVSPKLREDERGFFAETYNQPVFAANGIAVHFIQDNHSQSQRGVLRGLHFQRGPFAQDKLVRVVEGEVFDVAVDLRQGSSTFGKWVGVNLSAENKEMLFIPKGFAHGFAVLSETAQFVYKTSNVYSPEHDGGVRWNDPDINIVWPISSPQLSEKDNNLPLLKDLSALDFGV
jgi:dTDP-4-dehydrorhamnose 3,5-epimerase